MYTYLIEVQADHSFGDIVARHVIIGDTDFAARANAEAWALRRIENELQTARHDDPPNVDIHYFSAQVRSVSWSRD